MLVKVFEVKMSKEEAYKIAQNKGSWIWRRVFSKNELTELRLLYVEYVLFNLTFLCKRSMLNKLTVKGRDDVARKGKYNEQYVKIICNGTSCRAALVDSIPKLVEIDIPQSQIQDSEFSEEELIRSAKKISIRAIHRVIGGLPQIASSTCQHIYRPFWVAYYGEMKEGNKVRYITIPADYGHTTKRGEFFKN